MSTDEWAGSVFDNDTSLTQSQTDHDADDEAFELAEIERELRERAREVELEIAARERSANHLRGHALRLGASLEVRAVGGWIGG
jgi:hypothetical protein